MKRLLSLNSYHYRRGGSDVVYLDHAELLEANGWENTFFSMHHPKNIKSKDEGFFIDLVDFEYTAGFSDKLITSLRTIYNTQARRKIRALIAQQKFEVAHAHCIYHHLTPSIFKDLNEAGIPVVVTAHDLKIACPTYKMMNSKGVCEKCKGGNFSEVIRNKCIKDSYIGSTVVALEAYLYKALNTYNEYVSHIIAPSKFYREKLIEWGIDKEKITYVPNFTKPIPSEYIADYVGNPLYFGRLSEEKGLFTLAHAAKLSNVEVDIVGDGPILLALKKYVAKIKAPINFLGRLGGPDLWRKIGSARATIIPSEWYENAPMSVLESFQLERPVVGANIGGIPELISPYETKEECGWLFESGNSEDLARTLETIMAEKDSELKRKGRKGRSLVLNKFSESSYFESVNEIYTSL